MKKILLAFVLVFSSIGFIPTAQAACTESDPCLTYAEVDASGVVVNTIVCQPSVCGASGAWAGKLNNNRLVPQIAADPVTHKNVGGILSVNGQNVTESNGVFTVPGENNTETKTKTVQEVEVVTTVSATVKNNTNKVFTYEDTVANPHNIEYKSAPVGASVSINENNVNTSTNIQITEEFDDRTTSEQFEDVLIGRYQDNSDILSLLSKWMEELKTLLFVWFL